MSRANSICYIMVGQPGSGKSTIVNKISNFINALGFAVDFLVLSTDNLIEDHAKSLGKTYDQIFSEYFDEANKIFNLQFNDAILSNRDIIIDRTNLTPNSRRRFLSQLPKNYEKVAVVVICSESVQNERLANRSGKRIPQNVVENMRKSYVKPNISEGFDDVMVIYND